jgi:pimeloyl-ACP methyl ester carboxylesterase
MGPAVSAAVLPAERVSRRTVLQMGSLAAAAAIAAMPLGTRRAAAQPDQSSVASSTKGTTMTASTPAATSAPTVVLVHGAFADASSWNGVIPDLLAQGYPVVAAANPLRGVQTDADYLASVLAGIEGPIVLVGHSYGGFVISNAATGNANVKALVYVAAFAPDAGESATDLAGQFPGSTLGQALSGFASPDGTDLYIQAGVFRSQFAADVPEEQTVLMQATQRPVTEAALTQASSEPAWKTIPSWFIYGELDQNIPAAAVAFMAERAGAKAAVEVPGASHVVMISQPEAVTEMILAATEAVSTVGAGA